MAIGIVGRKRGMTRIFMEDGTSVPVTVIEAAPNRITLVREAARDGYSAIQVTTGARRTSLVNRPTSGHFRAAGVEPGEGLWEFRIEADGGESFEVGGEITVERFEGGQRVDVTGTSKGKGFAGVVKRHNFRTQDATHGNSLAHRAPGSIGQCQTPGRVFKGKKMAGHMGSERVTSQNLEVVRVDSDRNLLLVRGAVPGAQGGHVLVRPTVKT
jgi:large subunit ribosomal protein L3